MPDYDSEKSKQIIYYLNFVYLDKCIEFITTF
jgi:hypothetical protein